QRKVLLGVTLINAVLFRSSIFGLSLNHLIFLVGDLPSPIAVGQEALGLHLLKIALLLIDFDNLLGRDEALFNPGPENGSSRLASTGRGRLGFLDLTPDRLEPSVQIGLRDCADETFPTAWKRPTFLFSDPDHFSVTVRVSAKQPANGTNGLIVHSLGFFIFSCPGL